LTIDYNSGAVIPPPSELPSKKMRSLEDMKVIIDRIQKSEDEGRGLISKFEALTVDCTDYFGLLISRIRIGV